MTHGQYLEALQELSRVGGDVQREVEGAEAERAGAEERSAVELTSELRACDGARRVVDAHLASARDALAVVSMGHLLPAKVRPTAVTRVDDAALSAAMSAVATGEVAVRSAVTQLHTARRLHMDAMREQAAQLARTPATTPAPTQGIAESVAPESKRRGRVVLVTSVAAAIALFLLSRFM